MADEWVSYEVTDAEQREHDRLNDERKKHLQAIELLQWIKLNGGTVTVEKIVIEAPFLLSSAEEIDRKSEARELLDYLNSINVCAVVENSSAGIPLRWRECGYENTFELVKQARSNPKLLTNTQVIAHITKPIHFFTPDRLLQKYRGRPKKRTPVEQTYQEAFERRCGLYQRLVRAPKSRLNAKKIRYSTGDISREQINTAAMQAINDGVLPHKLVTYVSTTLRRSDRQVRRTLAELGYLKKM